MRITFVGELVASRDCTGILAPRLGPYYRYHTDSDSCAGAPR